MANPLEARWAHLGVDGQALDRDPEGTITPHTFLMAPTSTGAPITISSLPHISLGGPGAQAAGVPASLRDHADLDVTRVLGEGGMGRVLLAHQRSLHREVAVKVIKAEIHDAAILADLLTEAVITGSLEHPGIVPVHALGCDDGGRPVLIMKRIEGVSWRELARDPQHPAWARLDAAGDDRLTTHLEILMQVCNALHFAHQRGIVHRDVKLANVMIGSCGEVYVVDWGIATRMAVKPGEATETRLVGTPTYMAPEMVQGEARLVDARTDVYLLGATLHSVLTGKPRHRGDTLYQVLLAAGDSRPFAYGPDIPPELAAICARATSADPADRYPSALAFRRAIAEYRRHQGSLALTHVAAAQLDELRGALTDPSVDARRLHRLMIECRFGFMQALRAWRENPAARAGLGACLGATIAHELSLRNREGAAALIAELPEPRPDLELRLAALDAELLQEKERDSRLRSLELDHDPSVDARPRALLFALVALGLTAVSAAVLWYGPRRLGHRESVGFMFLVDCVICTGLVLGRRRLRSTQAGRVGSGLLLAWGLATLGNRMLGARFDTPVDQVVTGDMWLVTIFLVIGAIAMPPGLGVGIAVSAGSAVVATVWPELAVYLYGLSGLLVCGLVARFGYQQIQKT
jgi:serine/threonine-protein kinase